MPSTARRGGPDLVGVEPRPGADGRFAGPSGSGRLLRAGDHIDLVLADDTATADRLAQAMS